MSNNQEISSLDKMSFANPQVERCVLSLCLKDYEHFLEVSSQVEETDFMSMNHAEIFSILLSLGDDGVREFDIHTILAKADSLGVFSGKDSFKYISMIKEMNIPDENLSSHISELIDRSYKYKLYKELSYLTDKVGKSSDKVGGKNSFSALASDSEKRIVDIYVDVKKSEDAELLSAGLPERLEELKERQDIVTGLRSGMPRLDRYLRGLNPGSLYVVTARAGEGKSTLLMNWALDLAVNQGLPVLYLDTEMLKQEIQTRALSNLSVVPEELILSGKYIDNERDLSKVMSALDKIQKSQYHHKYTPRFDIQELRRLAKKYKVKHNIQVLFFDYIKMNDSFDNMNETQYLGLLASALKDIAGELEIPVVSAAQLGRSAEKLSHARGSQVGESDRILRYANVLLALMPKKLDEIEKAGGRDICGTHRLQILKNRGGLVSYEGVDVLFDKHILRFKQAANQSEQAILEQRQMGLDDNLEILNFF